MQRWHLGITSPSSSVRPPAFVCLYVTLFVSRFLFCNNSSSTDAIEMKLHMWIELKRVKSHAQDPIFLELFPYANFLKEPGQVTHVFCGSASMSLKLGENVVWVSNSLDLGETASYWPSHPDPSCLHIELQLCLVGYGLNIIYHIKAPMTVC